MEKFINEIIDHYDLDIILKGNEYKKDIIEDMYSVKYIFEDKYILYIRPTYLANPQKIKYFNDLILRYNNEKIYIPQYLKTRDGDLYSFITINNKSYIFDLKYVSIYKSNYKAITNKQKQQVFSSLGSYANKYKNLYLCEWNTYLHIDNQLDNLFNIANNFYNIIEEIKNNITYESYNKVLNGFNSLYSSLTKLDGVLPECLFQGGTPANHILIDDDDNFVGYTNVQDCGNETIINYFLHETLFALNIDELCQYNSNELFNILNTEIDENIQYITVNYQLNDLEKEYLPAFKKIVLCTNNNVTTILRYYLNDSKVHEILNFYRLVIFS